MRTLATIQKVLDLQEIPGADSIEVASILGWKCVVKKGEFAIGDHVVYIEVDSILPERPEFEFMRPRGFRVRTIKLRGQISQGLVFPVSILKGNTSVWAEPGIGFFGEVGDDVTDMLGITKFEPPIPAQLSGTVRGLFPAFLRKTDEDRIQSFPDILQKFPDARCRVCEKLDGSSVTFYYLNGEFGVCSRNLELKEDDQNTFWRVAHQLGLRENLSDLGMNIALQGELVGEGIQKNKYGIRGHAVYFFDVFGIDGYRPFDVIDADKIIDQLGLQSVPWLMDIEQLGDMTVASLLSMSSRNSALADVLSEGIVVRSYSDMTETFITNKTVNRGRISFKVINPEFLLKHGE